MAELIKYEIVVDTTSGEASLKRFSGVVDKTADGAGTAGIRVAGLGTQILSMASAFGLATTALGAFQRGVSAVVDSTKKLIEYEHQLNGIMADIGAKGSIDQINAFARSLEGATGVMRDQSLPAFRIFYNLLHDVEKAERLAGLAAQFADSHSVDYDRVVQALVKTLEGQAKGLKTLGIEAPNAQKGLDNFITAAERAGKQGEDLNNRLDQMAAAWREIKDIVGEVGKGFVPVLELFTKFALALADGFTRIVGRVEILGARLIWLKDIRTVGLTEANKNFAATLDAIIKERTAALDRIAKAQPGAQQGPSQFENQGPFQVLDDPAKVAAAQQQANQVRINGLRSLLSYTNSLTDISDKQRFDAQISLLGKLHSVEIADENKKWADIQALGNLGDKELEAAKSAHYATLTNLDAKYNQDKSALTRKYVDDERNWWRKDKQDYLNFLSGQADDSRLSTEQRLGYLQTELTTRQSLLAEQRDDELKKAGNNSAKISAVQEKYTRLSTQATVDTWTKAYRTIQEQTVEQFRIFNSVDSKRVQALGAQLQRLAEKATNIEGGFLRDRQGRTDALKLYWEAASTLLKTTYDQQVDALDKQDEFYQLRLQSLDQIYKYEYAILDVQRQQSGIELQKDQIRKDSLLSGLAEASGIDLAGMAISFNAVAVAAVNAGTSFEGFYTKLQGLKLAGQLIGTFSKGVASYFVQIVTTGHGTVKEFRKSIGDMLAAMAVEQFTRSLTALAMGAIASTPWGAAVLGPPAPYYKAAAVHAIAGAALSAAARGLGTSGGASSNAGGGDNGSSSPTPPPPNPTQGLRPVEVTLVLQGAGFINDMDAFARDFVKSVNRANLQGSNAPLVGA